MSTVGAVGEFAVLDRLMAGARGRGVVVDRGDDAAVLRPGPGLDLVATTDAFVEGRHWLPEWAGPAILGSRLAAAHVSDVAAMGAEPRWALVSLGVRAEHRVEDLEVFERALEDALARAGAAVVGGNLTAVEGPEWMGLTLLGEVAPGAAWTRAGARDGDLIAVTGHPGRAGAGLALALALGTEARTEAYAALLAAWLEPAPPLEFARALARAGGVHAAVDLSDGLVGDLSHLARASGVGVELESAAFAPDEPLERAAARLGRTVEALRFAPGDDYQLVVALDPASRAAAGRAARATGTTLAVIGRCAGGPGTLGVRDAAGRLRPLEGRGFDHFAR